MKNFHVITGTPRSGSTLVCNLLAQNPEFIVSSTSPVPELLGAVVNQASHSTEVQAALIRDEFKCTMALDNICRAVVENWYEDAEDRIVIDKSRGWSFHALLLNKLYPKAKIILCVRDMRSVFASIEKQHQKNPVIDPDHHPVQKTLYARADRMLSPEGIIGQCVLGSNDVYGRLPRNVFVIQYEAFTMQPVAVMMNLYGFLGLDYYEHDYTDVENVSKDLDGLYWNKFPHEGSGRVTPTNRSEWRDFIPTDLARMIFERYPQFNANFGYQ